MNHLSDSTTCRLLRSPQKDAMDSARLRRRKVRSTVSKESKQVPFCSHHLSSFSRVVRNVASSVITHHAPATNFLGRRE